MIFFYLDQPDTKPIFGYSHISTIPVQSPSRCESSSYCRKHGPFFLKKVICIDLYRDSFYCCIDWCDTYPYISRVFCAKVFEKYWTCTHSHMMRIIIIITETNSSASAPLASHGKHKD